MKREARNDGLDGGLLIFGIIVGLIAGGLVTLFTAPSSGVAFRRRLAHGRNVGGRFDERLAYSIHANAEPLSTRNIPRLRSTSSITFSFEIGAK